MIVADDGGAQVSEDGGRSWSSDALATGQFYHVHATNDFPYRVCGAQQDNTAVCGPSRLEGGIDNGAWQDAGGGESGWVLTHRDSTQLVYAGDVLGRLTRTDLLRHQMRDISVWPDYAFGHATSDQKYRFTYTFPIWMSPHDPDVLYAGSQVVHRTRDGGRTWEVISGDLTRNDPATQGPSGGPISAEHTGPEMFSTIFAGAESPLTPGVIWVGSDDGLVHLTRDGGRTWADVTPPGAPRWLRISSVEPSHHDPGDAYLAATRYKHDDTKPYLFKTTDFGRTWTMITNGIPDDEFTRVVREDPDRRGLLYAGTETGVHVSFDDGAHWQSACSNLRRSPVHDLIVKEAISCRDPWPRIWILDDMTPLRQMSAAPAAPGPRLFAPSAATRAVFTNAGSLRTAPADGSVGGSPVAANPPSGAIVDYVLAKRAHSLQMEFLDSRGERVRAFVADTTGEPSRAAGAHRFVWDLRYPSAAGFRGMNTWSGETPGPQALPDSYTVRLTVDGAIRTQPLRIVRDPRSQAAPGEDVEKFAFLQRIVADVSEANLAVRTIRSARAQLTARARDRGSETRDGLVAQSRPLLDALADLETRLYQTRGRGQPVRLNDKLAHLADVVDPSDGSPSAQVLAVRDELEQQLHDVTEQLRAALSQLAPINRHLASVGAAPVVPSTEEPKEP